MLQPNPTTTAPVWPITGDEPDLLNIVQAQALTIARQEALIDAYQSVLADAQLPPDAHGTGTATGTSLAMTAVTGVTLIGAVVTGTGIPAAPPTP